MVSVVALGAITGGTNINISEVELAELGFAPDSYHILSGEQMEAIRQRLVSMQGQLPPHNMGGSIANTADFIARAGVSCGLMGIGGNDAFGQAYAENCKSTSLEFISPLLDGAVTGYDFYLDLADGRRTILWTAGANSLLSPGLIDSKSLQEAELLLLDGGALDFGPESEAAVSFCAKVAEEAQVPFVLTLASTRIVESYRSFFTTYAPRAQMVAGNLEQAAVLVGLEASASLADVRKALSGTSINAVVTMDADGAFARFGDDEFLQPTQKIEPFDSVGAGDNFLGAFIVSRLQGLSIRQSLALGNFVSSKIIQIQNARLPLDCHIKKLLRKAMESMPS